MSQEALVAEARVGGGALSLYRDLLVHRSDAVTETIPLAQLASVRIAFERDAAKLGGAIALGLVAALLLLVAAPLRAWLAAVAVKAAEPGTRESLESVLHSVFSALAGLAGALPAIAVALLVAAAALSALWAYGRTTLTLSFAATARVLSLRGRNAALIEFAESLAARLSALAQSR